MSKNKKKTRDRFRSEVFGRDGHKCRLCGKPAVDAHHIINRNVFTNGGYVKENGISLCESCHLLAEKGMPTPEALFLLIGSSAKRAQKADKLNAV